MQFNKLIFTIIFFLCTIGNNANATSFDFHVDTTPIQGLSGFLAFDFINGDATNNNQVSISSFTTNGTLGSIFTNGGVSGALVPGPLIINDSAFFNEASQEIIFGSTLFFRIAFTTNGLFEPFPDSFSFFLLDDRFSPFATNDPLGADALLVVDITANSLNPELFTSEFASITASPTIFGVPEPGTVFLIISGLLFLRSVGRHSKGR